MSLTFVKDQPASASLLFTSSGAPVTGLTFADVTAYTSKNGGPAVAYPLTGLNFTEIDAVNMPGVYSASFSSAVTNTLGELIAHFSGGTFDTYLIRATVFNVAFNEIDTTTTDTLSQSATNSSDLAAIDAVVTATQATVGGFATSLGNIETNVDDIQGAGFVSGTDSLAALRGDFDTRIPEEVSRRSDFVNGAGNLTPPVDVGLWDVLGDGTTSISDLGVDLKRSLGLSQENYRVTGQTYDANNNLISGVIAIYPSAVDLNANTNVLATYVISSTYDANNRLVTYQVAKQ